MVSEVPISLGVAGLGLAGSFMLRALDVDARFKVVACAEPRDEPRKAFCSHYGARGYSTFHELCADAAVEAVYIATPHQFHAEQAVLALAAGKHVIVEKPMGLTLSECDTLVAAAQSSGRHVVVGHSHAFDPNVQAIGDLVRSGRYGRLGMIHTFNYNDFLFRAHRADEFNPKSGGGILFNQVAHQVEIIRRIAGEPVARVRAHLGDLVGIRQSHGHCSALIQFVSGASASFVFSSYGLFDSDEWHEGIAEGGAVKNIEIGAMRRAFMARDNEATVHQGLGFGARQLPAEQPSLPHFGILVVSCAEADIRLAPNGLVVDTMLGRQELPIPRSSGWAGHGEVLTALWDSVRLGKPPLHDAVWGRETIRVLQAIERSHREAIEVNLLAH